MANGRQRDLTREQFWRDMCQRQADSGLPAAAFCARQGVMARDLYRWRSVLRRRDRMASESETGPGRMESDTGMPAFVPVQLQEPPGQGIAAGEMIAIDLRGGRVMHLPPSLSLERVAALALLLEGGAA